MGNLLHFAAGGVPFSPKAEAELEGTGRRRRVLGRLWLVIIPKGDGLRDVVKKLAECRRGRIVGNEILM